MRHALLRPTHLVITGLLLIAGLAGVAAGLAVPLDAAPSTWEMPALEPGQQATYVHQAWRTTPDGPVAVGEPRPLYRFEVMQPVRVYDAHGVPHEAHGIHIVEWDFGLPRDGRSEWRPARSGIAWAVGDEVIAYDQLAGVVSGANDNGTLGVLRSEDRTEGGMELRWYVSEGAFTPDPTLPCGIRLAFQGISRNPEVGAPLDGCRTPRVPSDPARMSLSEAEYYDSTADTQAFPAPDHHHAAGTTVEEGRRMLVLAYEQPGSGVDVWLPEDRPTVERMVWHDGDRLDHVVTLQGWAEGTPVRLPSAGPGALPLPGPEGLVDGLPDDRGIDHPFPASLAWRHARQDATVTEYLEEHPAARLYRLDHQPAMGMYPAWEFTWSAGPDEETLYARVEQRPPEWNSPLAAPEWLTGDGHVYETEADIGRYSAPATPLDGLPDALPSAASLATAAAAMGVALDDWGWSFVWRDSLLTGDGSGELHIRVTTTTITESEEVDTDSPGIVDSYRYESTAITFDGQGRLARSMTVGWHSVSRSAFTPSIGPADGDDPVLAADIASPSVGRMAFTAGGIGVLAAILYFFWPLAKNGVAALFSRVHPDQALDHPTRQRIASLIAGKPGIHGHDIARAADIHRSTVDHHLRKLVDTGHVIEHRAAGYTCYYPKGTDRRIIAAGPALKSETARNVVAHLREHPGATAGDIAQTLGISRSTVSHHIKRLGDAGLVERRRDGQAVRLWASLAAVAA